MRKIGTNDNGARKFTVNPKSECVINKIILKTITSYSCGKEYIF